MWQLLLPKAERMSNEAEIFRSVQERVVAPSSFNVGTEMVCINVRDDVGHECMGTLNVPQPVARAQRNLKNEQGTWQS